MSRPPKNRTHGPNGRHVALNHGSPPLCNLPPVLLGSEAMRQRGSVSVEPVCFLQIPLVLFLESYLERLNSPRKSLKPIPYV